MELGVLILLLVDLSQLRAQLNQWFSVQKPNNKANHNKRRYDVYLCAIYIYMGGSYSLLKKKERNSFANILCRTFPLLLQLSAITDYIANP